MLVYFIFQNDPSFKMPPCFMLKNARSYACQKRRSKCGVNDNSEALFFIGDLFPSIK